MRRRSPCLVLVCLALSAPLRAQIPRGGPTAPVLTVNPDQLPGLGPGRAYLAEDWELWWYLNRERVLRIPERWRKAAGSDWEAPAPAERVAAGRLLTETLRDNDQVLRQAIAMALARSGVPDARPTLEGLAEDKGVSVRRTALLALGVLGDPDGAPFLAAFLEDDRGSEEEQFHAALALGLLADPAVHDRIAGLLDPKRYRRLSGGARNGLAVAAGLTGARDLVDPVRRLLKDRRATSAVARAYLAEALGHLGDADASADLVKLLQDKETLVRRAAAMGIGELMAGSQDAGLAELLGRGLAREREAVTSDFLCIALGRIGGPAAAQALLRQFAGVGRSGLTRGGVVVPHFDLSARTLGPFAALSLGLVPAGTKELRHSFRDESDHHYRGALALALGLDGDPAQRELLRETAAAESDPELRAHLELALGMLGDAASVPRWLAALDQERDRRLLWAATVALGLTGERAAAVEHLLARLAAEPELATGLALLHAVGLVGGREALAPVQALLADTRQAAWTRVLAAVALGGILDGQPLRTLALVNGAHDYTVQPELFSTLRATW